MAFGNPIPYAAWEEDLAALVGATPSLLRFAVSFFASVPIGAGLRYVKSPKGEPCFRCQRVRAAVMH